VEGRNGGREEGKEGRREREGGREGEAVYIEHFCIFGKPNFRLLLTLVMQKYVLKGGNWNKVVYQISYWHWQTFDICYLIRVTRI